MSAFFPEDHQGKMELVSDRDITFEADYDQDGEGDFVVKTGGVERLRVDHAGVGTGLLGGSITSSGQRTNGVTAWALGDSITKNGSATPAGGGGYYLGDLSHFAQLVHLSDGRLRFAGFGATGGYTTQNIIDNWLAAAVAAKPGICVVLAGTNDAGEAVPIATSIANLTTIYTELLAARTLPLLCTIPPRPAATGYQADISNLNAWIRRYAFTKGLPCADYHAVLTDPATGAYLAAYDNGDGTHPNGVGAFMMAQEALAKIGPWVPWAAPDLVDFGSDPGVLVSNALFQTDSGGGLPSQWALGSGSGATLTLAADPSVQGNAWTIQRGAADLSYYTNPRPAVNVGDLIRFSCLVKWQPANGGIAILQVEDYPGDNVLFCPISNWGTAFGWHLVTGEFTASNVGTTNLFVNAQVKTGQGSRLSLAQMTLRNLTAEGVA